MGPIAGRRSGRKPSAVQPGRDELRKAKPLLDPRANEVTEPSRPDPESSNGVVDSDDGDVQAAEPYAAEEPTRLCPHCATLSRTSGDFCPHCGLRFTGKVRDGISRGVKIAVAALFVLVVLGGAGVAVAIKVHHDNQVAAQHRQAVAALKARQQAEQQRRQQLQQQQRQQQAQRAAEVSSRQALEGQLQTNITKDATQKASQGFLTSGPAQSTTCTRASGGSSQNLSEASGTYSCIAVYQTNSDGTQSGYRYSGTINFDTGMLTWQPGGTP